MAWHGKMVNPTLQNALYDKNCHDNTKLAGHGLARYKMEWIYMRAKVSGLDSPELAIKKWPFFEHLVLAFTRGKVISFVRCRLLSSLAQKSPDMEI